MKTKGTIFQLLVMIVGMIKGFASLKLMVSFGHESYALLSQFLIMASFATQIIILNYDAPFVAKVSAGEDISTAYSALLHLLIFNFSIVLLFTYGFNSELSLFIWGDEHYAQHVAILVVYVFVLALNLLTLLNFQARKKFDYYAGFQISQQLLQLLAVTIGVYVGNVFLLLFLLVIFELLLWSSRFFQKDRPKFYYKKILFSFDWIKSNAGIAAPLFISSLMIWILNNGGRLMLVNQHGLQALAPYAATFSIVILAGLLINPICSVFFPYFSGGEENSAEIARSVVTAQLVLLIFGGGASIFMIVSSKLLIGLLAASDLFAGRLFVFLICIAQIFYGQARINSLYLAVNAKALSGLYAFIFGAFVLIFVGGVSVGPWSELGIALAFSLGCLASAIWLWRSMPDLLKSSGLICKSKTIPLCWGGTILFMGIAACFDFDSIGKVFAGLFLLIPIYICFLALITMSEPIALMFKSKLMARIK